MTDAAGRDDSDARERALDVTRSFLVQAPAGSGKTELLIQRFLALLPRVDRPERIVAMTFTRKAAGEMRVRIARALADARERTVVASPHEARTRALAEAALAQDARCGWQLTSHPARLAVQTIDAFCVGVARQAPLATRLGAAPRFVDDARALYEAAVRRALAEADPRDAAWGRLLRHLDNDARRAVSVLSSLLARRAPFLRELAAGEGERFRAALEAVLADEIRGELETIARAFPPVLASALPPLERHAARHAEGTTRAAPIAERLLECAAAGGVPPATLEAHEQWRALASWLLVANAAEFRRKVDRNDGFPPGGAGREGALRAEQGAAMAGLLAELAAVPGLAAQLDLARRLPPPRYGDDAWTLIGALQALLPRLAGELTLAFRDQGALDFVQGTIAAIDALGAADAPTDLLLKLDARIEHLLVDEFQDTSFIQLELLRRLTAGWTQGDGRTLFAVGDPMQSIYRFREAEVRIFVDAQDAGRIADVPVENLRLAKNFRAHEGLVDWVNGAFPRVLGSRNDPWRGAVAFAPAIAVTPPPPGAAVTLDVVPDPIAEAERVADRVHAALESGPGTIAVLVRARTHLDAILPALRAAGIGYAAVELDALAERQAIHDLASLTHALAQPADRLAWFAVLRAPWCGLVLGDLFAVAAAAAAHPSGTIAALMAAPEAVAGMTEDGAVRLAACARVLHPALSARGRASLAARVRGAWLALGGPALLDEAIDVEAAERFLGLLAASEIAGDVPDWTAFVAALEALYVTPADETASRVQVMTLHRAKGLEFDTVVMPGLARTTAGGDPEILQLRIRERGVIVAPSRTRGGEADPVYAYLALLAADEDRAELARLLYVGCTRAKARLHLTASLAVAEDGEGRRIWAAPPRASALARMRDVLAAMTQPPPVALESPLPPARAGPPLVRVASGWTVPEPGAGLPVATALAEADDEPPFDWARETARQIGVVAHRWLAQIARDGLAAWNDARIAASATRIRGDLASEGVVGASELDRAAAEVATALANVLSDPRARWLLAPEHEDARSEWALSGVEEGVVVHVVVDRTFVADGVRWIIDFKTGRHEGADTDAFLDLERERYRGQLERYARFVGALDPRPVRLALYHPLLRGWREWPHVR
jgi:ATP-dependent helicase/nuclease subunit A